MFNYTKGNDAAFWVQLKGENAGRPLKERTPNSIGITTDSKRLVPEYFYYVVLYLYESGIFRQYLKGSVVPYITQRDITIAIINYWSTKA
jgi:hypothetical protein